MSISTVKPTTCTIFEFIEYHSTLVLISPWPDPPEKKMKGRHFSSDAEAIAAAETWLDRQNSEFFEWLGKVGIWSL